jgi:UDP-3-O-[3-hydroxymyristoyl] N-acetylglucosamine deacetylase/3-hydroxyacyl-[acyl-carrier-protein] dehydratase
MPLDGYRLTCMIDFNSPVLGSQHASISQIEEFQKEISSSRTFCFLHELEALVNNNLIKGGDLSNAIVIVDKEVEQEELNKLEVLFNKKVTVADEGILDNIQLRYQNEPARHKLLDMIGDLALVGRPIKGHIMAARPGHAANVAFAKRIKNQIKRDKSKKKLNTYDIHAKPVYDTVQIMNIQPHRQPFLMIDKVLELVEEMDKEAVSLITDLCFKEHKEKFIELGGQAKFDEMIGVISDYLLGFFIKKQTTRTNTINSDLAKILNN